MSDIGIRNHPVGSVCLWHGLIINIPTGWFLMDGTNGTNDLTAKFIRGAADGQDSGGTGGTDTHTIIEAELAAHDHTLTDPTHTHSIGGAAPAPNFFGLTRGDFIVGGGTSLSRVSGISIGSTGSGTAHENRPQFFELAYIQRKT